MDNSSVVVRGDASKTDSDEENVTATTAHSIHVQGAIITGEISEWDDDQESISSTSTISALQTDTERVKSPTHSDYNKDFLLHTKLRESNIQLYGDLNSFCQNVVNQAERNLTTIDQQLLKLQITLQSAVTSLRSLHVSSSVSKDKLHSLMSSLNVKTTSTD